LHVRIAVNRYNFQWTFPEIVADKLGLFSKRGIDVTWNQVTPKGGTDKGAMYTELLESGKTVLYHAGEWVCILRVLADKGSWVLAKSVRAKGTLNSTFTLFVRRGAGYKSPKDLKDKPVAIEAGTGSYYTALQDLERFLPKDSVRLVQVGEPHRRMLALLEKEVEAASLLSPWTDLARYASLKEILTTARSNPTTAVVRRDEDPEMLGRLFQAVNEAIDRMNAKPNDFREMYFAEMEETLREMPPEVRKAEGRLRRRLEVPRWSRWVAYTREDFQKTYGWMVERGLAPAGRSYDEVVAGNTGRVFG